MTDSLCCGAATNVEFRPDLPLFYDDPYPFWIPVRVCTKCGKVFELQPNEIEAQIFL
ncbi:hypothetical protein [Ferviditalea candida]|uniref:hypothetical protein n=1 Tax=Ferviditalea candida TaxID=3108399 RepID=UPI00352E5CD8